MRDYQIDAVAVWDEMKIKSGLVTSKSTGKIISFCELGTFNNECANFSKPMINDDDSDPKIATHILLFMVRGIMTNFNLPFMWFPCCGVLSELLWSMVWKVTNILENIGLPAQFLVVLVLEVMPASLPGYCAPCWALCFCVGSIKSW